MKDQELETYLLASRPIDGKYSPFTLSVLDAIRDQHQELLHDKQSTWRNFPAYVQRPALRKAVTLAAIILMAAFVSLSGYAYAHGTDPFSLIKRWVVGEQVKVTYQDPQTHEQREFSHGAKRSYSDLAVSAFAEVSLIDVLHFHAENSYTVPKNGIEYITDPFRIDYISPRVGMIERVGQEDVVLHLTYSMGQSKMEPSRDIDEHITIPRAHFYYYQEGKPAVTQEDIVGKLVVVYQDQFLRHKQHSGERPTPVDLYSAFAATHPFDAIKEATTTKGAARAETDEELSREISMQDIYELSAGAWSEVCLNNGADACPHAFRDENGDNFFSASIVPGDYGGPTRQNPNMIPFGEAIFEQTTTTRQYQLRHIEGRITKIEGDRITLKTKSGELWSFQYAVEYQNAFGKTYGQPLKEGQLLAGGVVASVHDWDRRDFDSQYVFGMSRYR